MAEYRQKTLWLAILFVLLVFTACDSAQESTPTPIPPDEVSFQLNWVDTIEYSGFYVAEENGYYAEENISLEMKPFDFAINPVELVVSGEATFATIGADKLLLARQAGQPIVAIATIYQRSPVAFVSLQDSNISRLQDLIGKKVLISPGGTSEIIFQAMLESGDVSLSDIEIIPRTDFGNDALINGEVDVMDVFINNQPIQLAAEGYDLNVILAADYGVAIYANIIFTTEDMIANRPDVVQRFL
jgi:NitT/TauT family transport system substrate-binding protein